MEVIPLLMLLAGRTFHPVPIAEIPTTIHTHAQTCGTVALVKREDDSDRHIRLEDGQAHFVVAEIIPERPLPVPTKGRTIVAWGITREDKAHGWYELHPLLGWREVASCPR